MSAVILERIDAGATKLEVRSAGSRLSVREADAEAVAGTRLLRSTFVHEGKGADAAVIPERLRVGGLTRLERRVDVGEERIVTVDRADRLTITRVVASNS